MTTETDQPQQVLPPKIMALDPEIRAAYAFLRLLPNGTIVGVHRLIFHWTLHYGLDWCGYEGRYCFETYEGALLAAKTWDGTGDPDAPWHKHPPTGRRRDPVTGEIWHESEDNARATGKGRFASKPEAVPKGPSVFIPETGPIRTRTGRSPGAGDRYARGAVGEVSLQQPTDIGRAVHIHQ